MLRSGARGVYIGKGGIPIFFPPAGPIWGGLTKIPRPLWESGEKPRFFFFFDECAAFRPGGLNLSSGEAHRYRR